MHLTAIFAGWFLIAIIYVATTPSTNAQTPNHSINPNIVVVQPGDTLSKIAAANATSYERLFDANLQIQDPDMIHPGNQLRIPDPNEVLAKRVAAPAPVKSVKTKSVKAARPAAKAISNGGDGTWDRLAACESGGNWNINTGNGYSGGLQFSQSSWRAVGGSGSPHQASKEEQIARGKMLQARGGWGNWPACASKLGLR